MKKDESKKYAILILAAGASSRLGRPKQLVTIGKDNLLSHTIEKASKIKTADTHIILGAYANEISEAIKTQLPIHVNSDWTKGMGNSIAFGVSKIKAREYHAVLLTVCDQPYLKSSHFEKLIAEFENGSNTDIVVSKYSTGSGPPSLFSNSYFKKLSNLDGEAGAKSIVHAHKSKVKHIYFELGDIDIDSEEDLKLIME